jgi:hypothetical protein
MSAKKLVLILALAAGAITAVYAMQRPAAEEAVPVASGVERVVIIGKREHGAEQHR